MSGGMFSLEWWITAGVAGVAASVFGAYVVRWLDRGGGSAVRWISTVTRRRRLARAFRIAEARADDRAMNRLRRAAVLYRLDGIAFLVFTAIVAGLDAPMLREG